MVLWLEASFSDSFFDIFFRTPSKQKSPKKEEEINIVELLRGHDPKEYEKILREHGIHDYRAILQAVEFLKKEKEMESGKVVRKKSLNIYLELPLKFMY